MKYDKKLLSLLSSPMAIGTIVYPGARIPSRTLSSAIPIAGEIRTGGPGHLDLGDPMVDCRKAWGGDALRHEERLINSADDLADDHDVSQSRCHDRDILVAVPIYYSIPGASGWHARKEKRKGVRMIFFASLRGLPRR